MTDLCIDTSGGAVVAVVDDQTLSVEVEQNSKAHAEQLSKLIVQAIAKAGLGETIKDAKLDQVIVGTGPAPFTGLRAGLVTAKVIGRVSGIPVRGIGSLEILARSYLDDMSPQAQVVVVTDARRHEVYWAHVRAAGPNDVEILAGPAVNTADQVANRFRDGQVEFVGPGCAIYPDALPTSRDTYKFDISVASRIVRARLDNAVTEFPTDPQYLRRPDVHGAPK